MHLGGELLGTVSSDGLLAAIVAFGLVTLGGLVQAVWRLGAIVSRIEALTDRVERLEDHEDDPPKRLREWSGEERRRRTGHE